jgi:hypothetical protein
LNDYLLGFFAGIFRFSKIKTKHKFAPVAKKHGELKMNDGVTKGVFYFSFNLEFHESVDETLNYGFAFDFGDQPVFPFNDENMDEFDDLEEKYGIHNFYSRPDARVIGVGYDSYEVYRDQIDNLMTEWRDAFVKICDYVGPVVQLDTLEEGSDYDSYLLCQSTT